MSKKMSSVEISAHNLPDYASLKQLGRAMWRAGSVRGVAVLIGAGLSKNARRAGNDTPDPPLWYELSNRLISRLYPLDPQKAPTNPLRIAEEYRTSFGQAGLDDFIRSNFPDHSWSPSQLHMDLLSLPWTDVLTTNWDTLLERTAQEIASPSYTVVKTDNDLTYAAAPRIVKLHGTIGDKDPLIFAEDDYRTYAEKYAAFVNLARQVFIENELILIGFSGDDPNFLQWAGWVRDHLGGSARRIYLAGNLNLQPATRKYLESRNIAPIDLSSIVSDLPAELRHGAAIQILVDDLLKEKPLPNDVWSQTSFSELPINKSEQTQHRAVHEDPIVAIEILTQTLPLLIKDRHAYPGWVICPKSNRRASTNWGERVLLKDQIFEKLPPNTRTQVAFESMWRHDVFLTPPSEQTIYFTSKEIDTASNEILTENHLYLAAQMMHSARLAGNDEEFQKWYDLISSRATENAGSKAEATYQLCLKLRDSMNFEQCSAKLSEIRSEEPVWLLRKASVYADLGYYHKSTTLIKQAVLDLEKRHRLDRNSLWVKSALGLAGWINDSAQLLTERRFTHRERDYIELKFDPQNEIDYFRRRSLEIKNERREEKVEIKPSFTLGAYKEGKSKIYFGGDPVILLHYEFNKFIETCGLPLRINNVDLAASVSKAVLELNYQPDMAWYSALLRGMHSHLDREFDLYFGRIAIAQLEATTSYSLYGQVFKCIEFFLNRLKESRSPELKEDQSQYIDLLRMYIYALSRLTIRISENDAVRTYEYACNLCLDTETRHYWLLEAVNDLIQRALEAIPPSRREDLAFSAIDFPLSSEKQVNDRFWPSFVSCFWSYRPNRGASDIRWDNRIQQLIQAAAKDHPSRQEAIFRLSYLHKQKVLKDNEVEAFGNALWSDTASDDNSLPNNTNLLKIAFLELPSPSTVDAAGRVKINLFDENFANIMSDLEHVDTRLMGERSAHLNAAAHAVNFGFSLSSEDASRIFDEIVSWKPKCTQSYDPFGQSFWQAHNYNMATHAGYLLSNSLVPSIKSEELNKDRLRGLLIFIEETNSWQSLSAIPYFFKALQEVDENALLFIRRGLDSREPNHSSSAAFAISKWIALASDGGIPELPKLLVEQLIFSAEGGRETGLSSILETIQTLIIHDLLGAEHVARIKSALKYLYVDFSYENVEWQSQKAVQIPLVRRSCIRLANAINNKLGSDSALDDWLEQIETDPLPEVRFSLISKDDD